MRRGDIRDLISGSNGNAGVAAQRLRGMMGCHPVPGRQYTDGLGNARLQESKDPTTGAKVERVRPEELSLKCLFEGFTGQDCDDQSVRQVLAPETLVTARGLANAQALTEAGGVGVGAVLPSAFANINAFTAATAGLLEVSILEAWQNPEFIADKLAPMENTKIFEGRKVVGTTRVGDVAEERLPGNPTKVVQFGERWIKQPRTVENALACEVTQEAVYLDNTGSVLEQAKGVGDWIAWREEIRTVDRWIGAVQDYSYKDTTFSTYYANGYIDNDIPSNPLLHWDNVKNAMLKFRDMTDPETSTRVGITPNMLVANLENYNEARSIAGDLAGDVQYRDAPGSTTGPQRIRNFTSPYKGQFEVLTSPFIYQRCVASDGLNLSAATAGGTWWLAQRGWLVRAVNWPLRVQQAAPVGADMLSRGVVLYVKADLRTVPFIKEIRKTVRSKPN